MIFQKVMSPVCAFWVDGETGVRVRYQLDRVAQQKYGITGEGELCWTLGMAVKRDFDSHIISLSQGSYVDNLVERFGLQDARTPPHFRPVSPGTGTS